MDHTVAHITEIPDGGMKSFNVGGTCMLLAREGQDVWAVGGHCTHQGAPLAEGVRVGRKVICPWHHAMFDLATGEHCEPPGEGRLMKFPVTVRNGTIMIALDDERTSESLDEIADVPAHKTDKIFAIVGAGAAGRTAAEELRRQNYDGRIILISMEKDAPYDRTSLSKDFLSGETELDQLEIISGDKLAKKGIELMLDKMVEKIDAKAKTIRFADGGELKYDACLAAPGSAAREPNIAGLDLIGVLSLRTKSDGLRLKHAASEAKKIVIIGSGFIGMETAAVFAKQGKLVTVVTPDKKPFAKIFGDKIAEGLVNAHREAGTALMLGESVAAIEGKDNRVTGVRLESGETVPADLVLVGIGAKPNIDILDGVEFSNDGGVVTDENLKAADGLWLAGDIASFPSRFAKEVYLRIEHWRLAEQLGRHAARAMMGDKDSTSAIVPFFWTHQHWTLALVGHPKSVGSVHIEGDVAHGNFMAYYIEGDKVFAGVGTGDGDKTAALHALFLNKDMPSVKALESANWDPAKLIWSKPPKAA